MFTLIEIEVLLMVCTRSGQPDEVVGKHFVSAKKKLIEERKRQLGLFYAEAGETVPTQDAAEGVTQD
jgi:hypothetical protein